MSLLKRLIWHGNVYTQNGIVRARDVPEWVRREPMTIKWVNDLLTPDDALVLEMDPVLYHSKAEKFSLISPEVIDSFLRATKANTEGLNSLRGEKVWLYSGRRSISHQNYGISPAGHYNLLVGASIFGSGIRNFGDFFDSKDLEKWKA